MTDGLSEAYESKQWDVFVENNDLLLENDRLMAENAKLRELAGDMGKMLTLASWTSVENDEQASQCIYRAEALGIEVDK